jgi:hypothetical protein
MVVKKFIESYLCFFILRLMVFLLILAAIGKVNGMGGKTLLLSDKC